MSSSSYMVSFIHDPALAGGAALRALKDDVTARWVPSGYGSSILIECLFTENPDFFYVQLLETVFGKSSSSWT